MKIRKLRDKELIQVGDKIKVEHGLGVEWDTVHRVTPKFAFVRYNEHAEGKFRREYRNFGFRPLPKDSWGTTQYSAWRPLKSDAANELKGG